MQRTVLFIMMPMASHYYVALGVARLLLNEGFRVYFTFDGRQQHSELIKKEGFESVRMDYATEYKSLSIGLMLALMIKTVLDREFTKSRYRSFLEEVYQIQRIEIEIKPSLILIDSHFSHYILFLWKSVEKLTILNTKLSTRKVPYAPPLHVGWLARKNLWSYVRAEWAWAVYIFPKKLKMVKERIAFLGYSDEYFYQRIIRLSPKNKVSQWLTWKNSFDRGAINVPKLITYPKCLEYTWKCSLPDEYYVEIPFQKSESDFFSEKYIELKERLKNRKPEVKIIYCALGTLGGNFLTNANVLIQKLVEAFENEQNIELIVALGNISFIPQTTYTNIHFFDKVPQLDMLKYADLMISHGGLNSISECIYAKVPILIYPLVDKCDHPGNAARVEANGYGLKGDIQRNSSENIKVKCLHILENEHYRIALNSNITRLEEGKQNLYFFN